jgi:hypothetical protein
MIRDFFLGFVKIPILYHVAKDPIYGAELAEELAHHGHDLSPGTLYPTLHPLERQEYLSQESRVVDGRTVLEVDDNDGALDGGAIALIREEGRTATQVVSVVPAWCFHSDRRRAIFCVVA